MAKTAGFIDVDFELAVQDLEQRIDDFQRRPPDAAPEEEIALLKEICVALRDAKLRFFPIARSYGSRYENQAEPFVGLAEQAAHAVDEGPDSPEVDEIRKGVQRHLKEIIEYQAKKMKAV